MSHARRGACVCGDPIPLRKTGRRPLASEWISGNRTQIVCPCYTNSLLCGSPHIHGRSGGPPPPLFSPAQLPYLGRTIGSGSLAITSTQGLSSVSTVPAPCHIHRRTRAHPGAPSHR
jgi:hypothetical protein